MAGISKTYDEFEWMICSYTTITLSKNYIIILVGIEKT